MTKRTRRNHGPAFKAKVALAAAKGEKTLARRAQQFDVQDHGGSGGEPARSTHEPDNGRRRCATDRTHGLQMRDFQTHKIEDLSAQHIRPAIAVVEPQVA